MKRATMTPAQQCDIAINQAIVKMLKDTGNDMALVTNRLFVFTVAQSCTTFGDEATVDTLTELTCNVMAGLYSITDNQDAQEEPEAPPTMRKLCSQHVEKSIKAMAHDGATMETIIDRLLTHGAALANQIDGPEATATIFRGLADKIEGGALAGITASQKPR